MTYAAVHARTGVHVVLAAHRAVANGLRVNGRRGAHPASGTFFFLRCLFRSQSKRRFPLNGALLRLGHGVVLPLSGDVFRVGAFVRRVAIHPSGNVTLPLFLCEAVLLRPSIQIDFLILFFNDSYLHFLYVSDESVQRRIPCMMSFPNAE